MRCFPWTTILIPTLLISACGSDKRHKAEIEIINGVEYVHNRVIPSHPEQSVEFVEEMILEDKDPDGNLILYEPTTFLISSTGNIIIADYQDQRIKVFSPDGEFLYSFGGSGQGPGEFQNIISMEFSPDGQLLVLDTGNRRTSTMDGNGMFLNSHIWRGFHFQLFMVGGESYIADDMVFGQPSRLFVKKYDLEGKEISSFGEFVPLGARVLREGDAVFSIMVPFQPYSVFAVDPERGWLYHCLNDRYVIEVFDRNSRLIRKIDRPYSRLPFTSVDAGQFYASIDEDRNEIFSQMARQVELPQYKTVTDYMCVDDTGNLWVKTHEVQETGSLVHGYDIFDDRGIYVARIWSDIQPDKFYKGNMYALTTDEEGYATLRRFRTVW